MLKISKISWLVLLGYITLGVGTFISIAYLSEAEDLFRKTEFFMQFNLVWFGLIIVFYGLYALYQNYKRISRLGLEESLDTQFLIVLTFIFMTIYAIMDFLNSDLSSPFKIGQSFTFATESTAKVFLYGAFMAGFLSILLPKLLKWMKKSKSGV
jgi:hypothetical protein